MKLWIAICLLFPLIAHASCFDAAAARYGVDPLLLKAIAWQESHGHANAVGKPLPGGYIALGMMQINTNHLDELAPYGIGRKDLFNGCKSIHLGAWVLANCIKDVGETWNSVGCYFAGAKSKNTAAKKEYVASVKRHLKAFQSLELKQKFQPTDSLASTEDTRGKMVVWNSNE